MKKTAVIICAAGASARFGGDRKKPFIEVDGRAAFLRSIDFFDKREDVVQIILAISKDDEELVKLKWGAALGFYGVKICHGGTERFETVANALTLVKDEAEMVAIHDAVRVCLKDQWLDELFKKAADTNAAILAAPVNDTIKKVADETITETVDRSQLYCAQTPQVFEKALLNRAYANIGNLDKKTITDDANLVEALGQKVHIVVTDSTNIKITRKSDLAIAKAIIKSRPKPKPDGPIGPYIEAQW
jgi:2-C-methyl-D-erythritol 4-phosphate cytidylyltransferase